MPSAIASILRASTRLLEEPLNIISFSTHERWQTGLSGVNAKFYLIPTRDSIVWNLQYAPIPDNHIIVNGELPAEVDFDLIMSQNKFAHFATANALARKLHIPLLSVEHCLPHVGAPDNYIEQLKQMRGDVNVFISEYSREAWGWDESEALVVHHGVDTNLFSPPVADAVRLPHLLSVVNDWINRDQFCGFNLWKQVSQDLPVKVVGKTPGLSQPAKDVQELVTFYQGSRVFLNTSLVSPIPTALLEAMACGCACVSTATAMIPEVIEHEVTGLISNDPQELRRYAEVLLNDAGLALELGMAARRRIENDFSLAKFVKNWDEVFRMTANIPYRGF